MPRATNAPSAGRARLDRRDVRRVAYAGQIPDVALAALLGVSPSAVGQWRTSRGIAPAVGRRIAPELWPSVAALAREAAADLSRWAPASEQPPATPPAQDALDPSAWTAAPRWTP